MSRAMLLRRRAAIAAAAGIISVPGPDTIAGLTLWLDAAAITGLVNNDLVGTWADQSGNGYNATAAGTDRPTYKVSGIGGRPALDFVANDSMAIALSEAAGNWTWFFVIDSDDAGGTNGNLRYLYDAATGRLILAQLGDNATDNAPGYYDGSWKVSSTAATTGAQVLEFNLSSTNGGKIYRSQTLLHSGTYTQKALGGTQRLGATNAGGSNFFDGRMAEVIVYNSSLGSTDRSTIYAYIADKYGI